MKTLEDSKAIQMHRLVRISAVALLAFAGIVGATQEYEDLEVLVAEVVGDIEGLGDELCYLEALGGRSPEQVSAIRDEVDKLEYEAMAKLCTALIEAETAGNLAAGTRVRKQMQTIKQAAQELRTACALDTATANAIGGGADVWGNMDALAYEYRETDGAGTYDFGKVSVQAVAKIGAAVDTLEEALVSGMLGTNEASGLMGPLTDLAGKIAFNVIIDDEQLTAAVIGAEADAMTEALQLLEAGELLRLAGEYSQAVAMYECAVALAESAASDPIDPLAGEQTDETPTSVGEGRKGPEATNVIPG